MESNEESINLCFDSCVHLVTREFLEVIYLIFIVHLNLGAIFNQVLHFDPSEVVPIHRECQPKTLSIFLHGPHTAPIKLIVQVLQVLEDKIFANHHLIHWLTEVKLEQFIVK